MELKWDKIGNKYELKWDQINRIQNRNKKGSKWDKDRDKMGQSKNRNGKGTKIDPKAYNFFETQISKKSKQIKSAT